MGFGNDTSNDIIMLFVKYYNTTTLKFNKNKGYGHVTYFVQVDRNIYCIFKKTDWWTVPHFKRGLISFSIIYKYYCL
jgi:hypothetical protein